MTGEGGIYELAGSIETSVETLADILEPWRQAAVAAGNAFLTPEWYLAYLEHVPEAQPFVVVVRRGDAAAALLPLVKVGPVLRFAAADVGDLFQPLILDSDEDSSLRCLFRTLAVIDDRWRIAKLDRVAAAPARRVLDVSQSQGLKTFVGRADELPIIDLDSGSWNDYLQGRSHNFRSDLGRKERTLLRQHDARYEEVRAGARVEAFLDEHFDLFDRRRPSGGSMAAKRRWVKPFFRLFAGSAAARGWLRLWRLEVDGASVATWCGWNLGGHYGYYQASFDDAYARFSPGTLLLARTIQAAIEEGCVRYDLLLGTEPFKTRVSTGADKATTLALAPAITPNLVSLAGAWTFRSAARRLPRQLRARLWHR